MVKYKRPKYPHEYDWDHRLLRRDICPKLETVQKLHENAWFEVRNRSGYYTIEPVQSHTVILPVVDDEAFVMVRVFRPVLDDVTLELPAGAFDLETESPEAGSARELAEETGIVIRDLSRFRAIPPLSVSPNRNPYLAFAFQVELSGQEFLGRGEHDEEIESVHKIPFSEAIELIHHGDIYASVPAALIARYLLGRDVKT